MENKEYERLVEDAARVTTQIVKMMISTDKKKRTLTIETSNGAKFFVTRIK